PTEIAQSFAAGPGDAPRETVANAERVTDGLVALYRFDEGSGTSIADSSGVEPRIDLEIADGKAVSWESRSLRINAPVRIQSREAARRLARAIEKAGEITCEAWITPEKSRQNGPARIVSLSQDPNERNFTLGHEGESYDFRLRSSSTSKNGTPSISTPTGTVRASLTHVVYTRDRSGNASFWVNGERVATGQVAGDLS